MAQRRLDRVRTIPDDWVELAHDGVDGTHRVSPRAVAHWESRGWRPAQTDKAQPTPRPLRGGGTGSES